MSKKKVFVSFDFDNDKILKDFIIGQSKLADSPFDVVDTSLKEAAPEKDWLDRAETKIKGSDMVLVMVSSTTARAPGVIKEIALAKKHQIRIAQVIGYRDTSPAPVPGAGPLYAWNWDNLKKLLN